MREHTDTAVPFKPPRERLSNMADPAEVARFKASVKSPADKIRLGEHMLNRNPDRIGPYLLLAEHAPGPMVRNVYLAQAVSVGRRVWEPWLKGDQTIAWWTDKATQPFMTALAMYGVELDGNQIPEAALGTRPGRQHRRGRSLRRSRADPLRGGAIDSGQDVLKVDGPKSGPSEYDGIPPPGNGFRCRFRQTSISGDLAPIPRRKA